MNYLTNGSEELHLLKEIWIPPSKYKLLRDDQNGEKLKFLNDHFPGGLKLTLINGQIVKLEPEAAPTPVRFTLSSVVESHEPHE